MSEHLEAAIREIGRASAQRVEGLDPEAAILSAVNHLTAAVGNLERYREAATQSGSAFGWCSTCSVEPALASGRCRTCEAAIREEREAPPYG